MKRLFVFMSLIVLVAGCGASSPMKYSPGVTYTGTTYRVIILSYSGQKDALGAAVLDLEGDDVTYSPHPDQKNVKTIEGLSFADASKKAREMLKKHCGVFTFSTLLLASPDNITIGYEIKPIIKETAYCRIGKPVSVNYKGPHNGIILISLPERKELPFTQSDIRVLSQ
jgi:hypothetical protein